MIFKILRKTGAEKEGGQKWKVRRRKPTRNPGEYKRDEWMAEILETRGDVEKIGMFLWKREVSV